MPRKPIVLSSRTLAETRIFRIEELDLEFSNGARTRYERLTTSGRGAVLVVPMLDDDHVLLIREYAAGTDRYELALPKGRVEAGEELLDAANREMMEEVGYAAHLLEHITSYTVAPGYMGHATHVILAQQLYEHRLPGDEPEPIEVVPWPIADMEALLAREDCTEARSIAALYRVRDRLSGG